MSHSSSRASKGAGRQCCWHCIDSWLLLLPNPLLLPSFYSCWCQGHSLIFLHAKFHLQMHFPGKSTHNNRQKWERGGKWSLHCCCCSVAKLCLTLCDPMNCSTPGFPVLHYLPVWSNSCPLGQWCHPTISSSVIGTHAYSQHKFSLSCHYI